MTGTLVASIGVRGTGYAEAEYAVGNRRARSRFAPAALASILGLRGWDAAILVTPAARQASYDALAGELAALGLTPRPVDISESLAPADSDAILDKLDILIPHERRIVLDVTYGLRHLPMIYLVSLAYLVPFKGVQVDGIYYGALEAGGAFVDLTNLFDLVRWAHAVEAAREVGDFRIVAARLKEAVARRARAGSTARSVSGAQAEALRFSQALSAGLPLETGLSAGELSRRIQGLSPETAPGLVRRAFDVVRPMLERWTIAGCEGKARATLVETELLRELDLVGWWIDRANVPQALSVLREWMVNLIVEASGRSAGWLDYEAARKPAEQTLNEWARRAKNRTAEGIERDTGSLWQRVSTYRNLVMHAGFSVESAVVSDDLARNLASSCVALLKRSDELRRALGGARVAGSPVFANLSNHPAAGWSPEQRGAALALAPSILDVPLPAVPAEAGVDDVRRLADEVLRSVPSETTHAMVTGEFTLTMCLVRALQERGVVCLAATTDRAVRSTAGGEKISVFRFVRFRDYPASA